MERSENSNSINMDTGPDVDSYTPPAISKVLMKYKTMGDENKIDEIELSSLSSQFEESEESETLGENKPPDLGICSDLGETRKKSFPKLLKSAPERKGSSEHLSLVTPLQPRFSKRYLYGHRKQTSETDFSDDEVRSMKSRKQVQIEHLSSMGGFIFQMAWMLLYTLALSATGPLLIGLPGDNMFVLMTWKLQITLIVFLPLAYFELSHRGSLELEFKIKYI